MYTRRKTSICNEILFRFFFACSYRFVKSISIHTKVIIILALDGVDGDGESTHSTAKFLSFKDINGLLENII